MRQTQNDSFSGYMDTVNTGLSTEGGGVLNQGGAYFIEREFMEY